jgi:hypothetical protein
MGSAAHASIVSGFEFFLPQTESTLHTPNSFVHLPTPLSTHPHVLDADFLLV